MNKMNTEFLELKHEFNPIEWVESYFITDGPEGLGIYSKCIELEGDPRENERLTLRKSLRKDELVDPDLQKKFIAYWAMNCGGFNGCISYISSTVVLQEAFEFYQNEKKHQEAQIRLESARKNPEIIQELQRLGCNPEPSSLKIDSWTAGCLFHGRKHIMWVDAVKNECRCSHGAGKMTLEEIRKLKN